MAPARVFPVDNLNWEDETEIEINRERKEEEEEKKDKKEKRETGLVYLCDLSLYHINTRAESGHFLP